MGSGDIKLFEQFLPFSRLQCSKKNSFFLIPLYHKVHRIIAEITYSVKEYNGIGDFQF